MSHGTDRGIEPASFLAAEAAYLGTPRAREESMCDHCNELRDRLIAAECRAIEAEGRERAPLSQIAGLEGALRAAARLASDNEALKRGAIRAGAEMAQLRREAASALVDEEAA